MSKLIIVVGGVVSGVGKGMVAASLALLLKSRSFSVQYLKFDGYYCVNAGILNPNEHGEVYVLDSPVECDLDLGHIERIAGLTLNIENICTSGTLFKELIEEQERGDYLGRTITNKPFITNKIQKRIKNLSSKSDVTIVEIGGTVDDTESSIFLEAICELKQNNKNDCVIILVSPVLWLETLNEYKTKPLQRSVRDLQSYGIIPDILVCRTKNQLQESIIDKISISTNIPKDSIFTGLDCRSIYEIPLQLYKQNFDDAVVDKLGLKRTHCRIQKYKDLVEIDQSGLPTINIGVVGKYQNYTEAYLSLKEAISHASVENNVKVNVKWINAEELEDVRDMRGVWHFFDDVDGVIIPGGFGFRAIEGKIKAIKYVREKKIPFLGICLGLQCAVIEIARDLCGIKDANSQEFDKETKNPVIHYLDGQSEIKNKCGTMRLGAYDCEIEKDSLAYELYKKKLISCRHRHRLECCPDYIDALGKVGFRVSGRNPQTGLVEIMELDRNLHPYFIGTQYHGEFKSRLGEAEPTFSGLIRAAAKYRDEKTK